jgi:hypothetical protein
MAPCPLAVVTATYLRKAKTSEVLVSWTATRIDGCDPGIATLSLVIVTTSSLPAVQVQVVATALPTMVTPLPHVTFYRNFPTKESEVIDDPFDPMIGVAVAEQSDELPPMERTCLGLLSVLDQVDDSHDEAKTVMVNSPA